MNTPTTTNLSPELLAAVERLAEALLRTEPVAAYQLASIQFEIDPGAQALLERLSTTQAELRLRQSNGALTQADLDTLRSIQRDVQANSTLMVYARAQQAALAYLPEINLEISQLLGLDFASLAGPSGCC